MHEVPCGGSSFKFKSYSRLFMRSVFCCDFLKPADFFLFSSPSAWFFHGVPTGRCAFLCVCAKKIPGRNYSAGDLKQRPRPLFTGRKSVADAYLKFSRAYFSSSSRKSGCAMDAMASARSLRVLPESEAMPYSVATY